MTFEPAGMDEALQRRLEELRSTPRRMHHVIDLEHGSVDSVVTETAPSPATRLERLRQLGHPFDTSIFDGPSYRLSARHTFEPSPLAWLSASSAVSFTAETDEIAWAQALDPGGNKGFMVCHFDVSPSRKSVAGFSVSTFAWAGATGHVTLRSGGASASIPVTHQPVNHTIDLVFTPQPDGPSDIVMILEPGIQVLAFFGMSFHGQLPVIFTTTE